MSKALRTRLEKIKRGTGEGFHGVLALMGRYYDELSEDEQERYCRYRGTAREVHDQIHEMVEIPLHFKVERRHREREVSQETIAEVERLVMEVDGV